MTTEDSRLLHEALQVNVEELLTEQGQPSSIAQRVRLLLSPPRLQEILSTPIHRASASSSEDFLDPNDLSIKEFLDVYAQLKREGKIKVRPVEEFREEDEQVVARIAGSGPVPISMKDAR